VDPVFALLGAQDAEAVKALSVAYPQFRDALVAGKVGHHFMVARSEALPKADTFELVADTVRQRQQFARKIKGLTAMGRASAYVLIGLPFFVALALTLLNPSYMHPLYATSTGHTLIMVGLMMMAFGSLILRKLVSFKG